VPAVAAAARVPGVKFPVDVAVSIAHRTEGVAADRDRQTTILRCVFGNPFHPVAFSPEWRTDTALALARTMYVARDFSAMPILADALQDAGCDSDDNPLPPRGGNLLDHCRGPGPHVRGCWVLDLVPGKV
jgi:hypothetical protein